MRIHNPNYPNFLNKEDASFRTFHVTLDNLFKSLRSEGIGSNSSKGLLRAIFYYCGKCFCLRGGQEHRNLSLSQFECLFNPDRYIYREKSSKNKQGGLKQLRIEHKVVTIMANKAVGNRCPVYSLYQFSTTSGPSSIWCSVQQLHYQCKLFCFTKF